MLTSTLEDVAKAATERRAKARRAVERIEADLRDRSGSGGLFDDIDSETLEEMRFSWEQIIVSTFAGES